MRSTPTDSHLCTARRMRSGFPSASPSPSLAVRPYRLSDAVAAAGPATCRLEGKGFAGRDQLRSQIIKSRGHVPSNAAPLGIVLMAEQKIHGVHLFVDKIADRIA